MGPPLALPSALYLSKTMLKFRTYAQLPGILKAFARSQWSDAGEGDGWLYRTYDGALTGRIPDEDIESNQAEVNYGCHID